MTLATLTLLAALSSADAMAVLLNSAQSVGVRTFAEAREIVSREAEAGCPLQQFVVGVTTDDKALAKRCIDASWGTVRMMADRQNDPLAWYLLSVSQNDFGCLRKAVNGGNVQALNAQGMVLLQEAKRSEGKGAKDRDVLFARSFACFRQAVDQNDPNGAVNLGTCYLHGIGCTRSPERGFLYLKFAARAGHPEAMDAVSDCYRLGCGVARDSGESLLWAMRARAARGDAAAEKWLEERK